MNLETGYQFLIHTKNLLVSWFNPPPKDEVVDSTHIDKFSRYSKFFNTCIKEGRSVLGWSKEKFEKSGYVLCEYNDEMCYCIPRTDNVLFSFKQ